MLRPFRVDLIMARFEREALAFGGQIIGGDVGPERSVAAMVADAYLRRGIPIARARTVGDHVELDIARPRGFG